jgi:Flp pilus assembly protein TadD
MLHADKRLHLPKKSKGTPVQNYNRDGVEALNKHDYARAKKLFYKAYLLDPNDPFTLNNLGYVAELEGDIDRAQRFYNLSAAMNSDAVVDKATEDNVEGKPVTQVAGHFDDGPMQVNKLNVEAISFLIKDRPFEAEKLLQQALKIDPKNAFTLNNLGYDMEQQGELPKAVDYYRQSAGQRSDAPIIVAVKKDWRGKGISEIASGNADRVQRALTAANTPDAQVAMLNLRGVSALNRNDSAAARNYFEQAYKQDPDNAFALNNMGYLAELAGDRETAQFYYEKAKAAQRADRRVTIATNPRAEGKKLEAVADTSDQQVDARIEAERQARRAHQGANVILASRGYSKEAPPTPDADPNSAEGVVTTSQPTGQPTETAPASGAAVPNNTGNNPGAPNTSGDNANRAVQLPANDAGAAPSRQTAPVQTAPLQQAPAVPQKPAEKDPVPEPPPQ